MGLRNELASAQKASEDLQRKLNNTTKLHEEELDDHNTTRRKLKNLQQTILELEEEKIKNSMLKKLNYPTK